jgi:hypothetical protein
MREAVYLPGPDVFLTAGAALWVYKVNENVWQKTAIPSPPGAAGQNRAIVYDPQRDLILMVLGAGGDAGKATIYALRYR